MKRLLFIIATLAYAQTVPNCPGFPGCRYTPVLDVEFAGQTLTINYTDITGLDREFQVYVRVPAIRTGKLPVMIWSHGGEGRNTAGPNVFVPPSELTAAAGYLTITPAFRPRPPKEHKALCDFLGAPSDELCDALNSAGWDRPFDMQEIIRLLLREHNREESPLYGRIDLDRIAVGGHSAGSGGTLAVAGANRQYWGKQYLGSEYFEDPAPIAFIALSPSAPGFSNMFDTSFQNPLHSWSNITRPVLVLTGRGDANEQNPHGRRLAFERMPDAAGTHYRFWFDDVAFGHPTFGEEACDLPGQAGQRKCAAFIATWSSAILSYLDAYVNKDKRALDYLNSGAITRIPGPIMEIQMSRK